MKSRFSACLLALCALHAEDGTRGILPEEFVKARPVPAAAKTATPKAAPATAPRYQAASPARPSASDSYRQVGVTIWRLRPSLPSDTGARILVQEEAKTIEWTPERLASNGRLRAGEHVRLTIESATGGYLYVIDRERHEGRAAGEGYLIFPTTRTRDGDNRVQPGRLIDIPAQSDQPNYFTLQRTTAAHSGEDLLVIIAPKPIPGVTIGPKALRLSPEQVAQWEKQWGSQVDKFEFASGAGKQWSKEEQDAAANPTRLLTQDEPPPQTIYRVAAKPEQPALIRVELRMGR